MKKLPDNIEEAMRLMRRGQLTPVDLAEYCLRRIQAYDEEIRAFEWVDQEAVRREALRLTQMASENNFVGLLHGIPIAIKDIIDVKGMPTKAGSPFLRNAPPSIRDGPVVAALRRSGAIILGKTVTTEWACLDPSATRNPWNTCRSPGGSSSGSAAAVAMDMCMAALGTQTGGSILRPAAFCGVCGLKPTHDPALMEGIRPVSRHLDHVGPICRTVADLRIMYAAMQQTTPDTPIRLHKNHPPTLHCINHLFFDQVQESVREAVDRSLQRLDAAVILHPTSFSLPLKMLRINHGTIMAVEATEIHKNAYQEEPEKFSPKISELINQGLRIDHENYVVALEHQRNFRQQIQETMPALLIMYTTPTSAPDLSSTGDPSFNSVWSYAGLPTVTVPCGIDREGLPVGVQIIARRDCEDELFSVAAWCENCFAFRKSWRPQGLPIR